MKVTEHGDHLIKLTRFASVNFYLVRESTGLTLIDTGPSGSARQVKSVVEREGAPLTRIAVTHGHPDHVGSLDALVEAFPDAEVSMGEREARLLGGDFALDPGEPDVKIGKGGFRKASSRADRMLVPGEMLGSLEVVAAPGHTPGQMAFLDCRDTTLIAGDAFQTLGGVAVAGVIKLLCPVPGLATWDRATSLESARKLRELRPARLAVGHGKVLEHPEADMDAAIATASSKVGDG